MALYRYKMKLANIRYSSRLGRSDFGQLPVGETFQCTSCELIFPSRDALAMHRMEAAAVGKKCSPVTVAQQRANLLQEACASLSAVHSELSSTELAKQKLDAKLDGAAREAGHELLTRTALPAVLCGKEKQQMINAAALQYAASIMSQWYMLWQQPSNGPPKSIDGSGRNSSCTLTNNPHCKPEPVLKEAKDTSHAHDSSPTPTRSSGLAPVPAPVPVPIPVTKTESLEKKVYVEMPHIGASALYFPETNKLYCPRCDASFSQLATLNSFIEHECFTNANSPTTKQSPKRLCRPARKQPKRPKSVQTVVDDCAHSQSQSQSQSNSQSHSHSQSQSKMEFAHACRYCLIGFQNDVLYSLHSGCHNINNPLQCNRCGIVFQSMNSFAAHTLIHG